VQSEGKAILMRVFIGFLVFILSVPAFGDAQERRKFAFPTQP